MLECVINISEGREESFLALLAHAVGRSLLDVHRDRYHHRSVFTLAGPDVVDDAVTLAHRAIADLDITNHVGVHPRLGTVDVVPFVPLGQKGLIAPFDLSEAIAARNEFSRRISESLSVPCFLYGPERSLPDIRRSAFHPLLPDVGPKSPHPRAGAICVGARNALVAYNVEAEGLDIHEVKKVASAARSEKLRTLGFDLTGCLQVSCNLVDPWNFGIEAAFDTISREVIKRGGAVGRTELVGLMPEEILMKIPKQRWEELGVDANSSIEARLSH